MTYKEVGVRWSTTQRIRAQIAAIYIFYHINKRRNLMRNEKAVRYAMVIVVLSFGLIVGCQHIAWKAEPTAMPESATSSVLSVPDELFDKVTLHLMFDAEEATIREKDYVKLNEVIDLIETYENAALVIEGHTDNIGSKTFNHTLSHKRADAVKKYIVVHSAIAESRIKTIGYGESRPLTLNETEEDRLLNRRVEILIIPE
jgi:outer membrane protein OmpA-like peptidoglycan-associated protein